MILVEAIEFSKQFPTYRPKIFTEIVECNSHRAERQGYVILTTPTDEVFSTQMVDYVKRHKLRIERFKDYWLICTAI